MATSAKAQLVALFNTVNSTLAQPLSEADVTFGAVAVYDPADEGDNRNSKLTITATAESAHFSGLKELHYIRLDADLLGTKAITGKMEDWDTDEEVLAYANAEIVALGNTDDVFTLDELTITRTNNIIGIEVKEGHIKYLAGKLAIYNITEEVVKTDLSTTNGELNGFTTS